MQRSVRRRGLSRGLQNIAPDRYVLPLALQEFEVLGLHTTLALDDEVTDKALDICCAYCHAALFPPTSRSKVKCLVGDGHLALKACCEDGPCKRAGRPRKNSQPIGKHRGG